MTGGSGPRVAVMGAGAIGCFVGGMLARAGAPVVLVGRQRHVEAIARDGLRLEREDGDERVTVSASTDAAAVRGADIVLVSVKAPDTEAAAAAMAPHLRADAVLVSLQNGVDNLPRMRRHLSQPIVPAVVYVAAAMAGPGHVRQTGRGLVIVGDADSDAHDRGDADRIAALFESAGLACRVSADVAVDLWEKLAMNCVFNGLSALTRLRYAPMVASPFGRLVVESLVREVVAVARAGGVALDDAATVAAAYRLADAMPGATSSTAQDLAQGRRTEIDELNGVIVRRGRAHGVPTPVNETIHAMVKIIEAAGPAGTHADRGA